MTDLPTVMYDREIFVRQQVGGISRYFSELYWHLRPNPGAEIQAILGFARSSNQHLNDRLAALGEPMPALRPVPRGIPRLLNGPDRAKDAFLTYRAGAGPQSRGGILHATYFRPRAEDLRRAKRLVVTLQDMIPEQLGFPENHPALRGKTDTIKRADLVIATTHHTSNLAIEKWGPLPIEVIALGVDIDWFSRPRPASIDFPYFLFVGTRGSYKNFAAVPSAVQRARDTHDVGLVIAGPPPTPEERSMVEGHLPGNRVEWCSPTDDGLAALYQHAQAFIFPSTMEGYGLPALEAAAAGTPVILADSPVFREVAGSWARFFDPADHEALADQLLATFTKAREEGSRPALPTWSATAAQHLRLYRSLGQSLV